MPIMTSAHEAIVKKLVMELRKRGVHERAVDLSEFSLEEIEGSRRWIGVALAEFKQDYALTLDEKTRQMSITWRHTLPPPKRKRQLDPQTRRLLHRR